MKNNTKKTDPKKRVFDHENFTSFRGENDQKERKKIVDLTKLGFENAGPDGWEFVDSEDMGTEGHEIWKDPKTGKHYRVEWDRVRHIEAAEDLDPDPDPEPEEGPLYFKTSDEAIKWQRSQITTGCENDSDEQIFNHMNESGWIDETPNGWRIVTDEEIEAGYWDSNSPEKIQLFDMKAQGFPNGPHWERWDYKFIDGPEALIEYWTNKKTGISYEVEAEQETTYYGAEVNE